jgi:lipopolysaccharide transport system ATP-binding protein
MADIAIRVEGLGKVYNVAARRQPQPMLREALTNVLVSPFTGLKRAARRLWTDSSAEGAVSDASSGHFWALRGVSFDVERAQIVAIIGSNGAGKSTLLKILSRITEPSEGRVEIHGRVASLLEVGTGFHPELTGRENVYLSGALQGMRAAEITRKLDEILAFAEVERFADTAVKRYSTGMYVRLAFSVSAHLDPEILIVDEVLAVGDVAFQRKCLAKMEDVREAGRTVLFVSHSMAAVTRLCERAILMAHGTIQKDGPAAQLASEHVLSSLRSSAQREWRELATAPGDDVVRLWSVRIKTEDGATSETIDIRRPVGLEMVFEVFKAGRVLLPRFDVFNEAGLCIFGTQNPDPVSRRQPVEIGRYTSTAWIPGDLLSEGVLFVGVSVFAPAEHHYHVHQRDAVAFHAVDRLAGDAGERAIDGQPPGVVRPVLRWTSTRE